MVTTSSNGRGDKSLSIETRADGVAVLTIDVPGESVNTLKARFADEFLEAVETIESSSDIRAATRSTLCWSGPWIMLYTA